jgi:hypothetical protein
MEKLSNEMLEHIFRFLPFEDLLNVTQVSRNFDKVVGDSLKLMDRIKIRIKILTVNNLLLKVKRIDLREIRFTSRRYQHLKITSVGECHCLQNDDVPFLLDLLETIGENIKSLEFFGFRAKSEFIVSILNYTPNLESLDSYAITYLENGSQDWNIKLAKLKNLKLRLITGHRDHPYDKLFDELTTLESLSLSGWPKNFDRIRSLLLNQGNLKHLELNDDIYVCFLDSEFINSATFKLETLNIKLGSDFDILTNFIASQKDLKKLSIGSYCDEDEKFPSAVRMFDEILKLENLKELRPSLHYGTFGIDFRNKFCPNIEVIFLSFGKWGESDPDQLVELSGFISVMPNLKTLDLSMGFEAVDQDLISLNDLKKLECLNFNSFDSSVMKHFQLENLQSMRCIFNHQSDNEEMIHI